MMQSELTVSLEIKLALQVIYKYMQKPIFDPHHLQERYTTTQL